MDNRKKYLGDGVYAQIDRCMVLLTTEDRGYGNLSNKIYLEVEVLQELIRYAVAQELISFERH